VDACPESNISLVQTVVVLQYLDGYFIHAYIAESPTHFDDVKNDGLTVRFVLLKKLNIALYGGIGAMGWVVGQYV